MSDNNGFIRFNRLRTALSQVRTEVDSDIASAISESASTLTSLINSGDSTTLSTAKGYADGLKIVIDSAITSGDSDTLSSANSYTDSKISSVNSTINDLSESIPGQIALALETYENSIDYADATDLNNHTSNSNNPHNVTLAQVGGAPAVHTHVVNDLTDKGTLATANHTHVTVDVTDLSTNYAAKSHSHTSSDISDLGNYAAASHTHTESDITDLGNYSVSGHTHTESDITDLGNYASATHSHNLSDINNISATTTEINYLSGVTGNIQQQLNSLTTSGTTLTLADLGGASSTDLSNHTGNTNNPHLVTYTQVGAAAASHTHTESDITDLGSYASSSHTHTESDITDLGNYAASSHTHIANDITDGSTTFAAISHTHTESDITDLGSYANSSHTHTESDITDLGSYAASSHTHSKSDITDFGSYAATSHTHAESDITDLGSYSVTGHTHTESDITDLGSYANSSHTHTVSDITDASSLASSSHTHLLSDVTDVTASNTEVNYLVNSTRNIQTQINDARMYGFFPAWEYQHEYDVEDCIKIPCCKTTQYLECMVNGVTGTCQEYPIYDENDLSIITGYKKLDEFESVSNGQCIVDGTCIWIVQDIRDTRPIGSITPLLWSPVTTYNAFDNYGIGLVNSTRYYDGRSNQQSNMLLVNNLKYIRLVKRIISSAIFTLNESRLFRLASNTSINNSASTELSHISGALVILDWCIRPFTYLDASNYNNIDEIAYNYINPILSNYNSTYSVSLIKSQIINDAVGKKTKIYNNQLTEDFLYLENNAISKYGIMQSGNYGLFQNAGLPNITGSLGYIHSHGSSSNLNYTSNTMYWGSSVKSNATYSYATSSGNNMYNGINFKASNSNSIYGNSTTVQPNTIAVYYYMKY